MEIIRLVENSELSVKGTLKELGINRSMFYKWYQHWKMGMMDWRIDTNHPSILECDSSLGMGESGRDRIGAS